MTNVLFLIIDGLRADKFKGLEKTAITPNIDSLIPKGTYFNQAISCADGTTLSLNTIFSGMFPFRTGTRAKEVHMNKSNYIYLLKNNGYHIYGIVPELTSLSRFRFNFENNIKTFKATPNVEHLWEGTGKKILDLLKTEKMKEPWFCYIHPLDLHDPYIVPKEFNDVKFGKSEYEKVLSSMDEWIRKIINSVNLEKTIIILTSDHGNIIPEGGLGYIDFEPKFKNEIKIGKTILPKNTHKFAGSILVKFKERIRERRLKKANKDLTSYQKRSRLPYFRLTLFDEAIRVPILFLGKNIPKNKIITEQVCNADIFPTIIDLINIRDPIRRDGRSLIPFFNDKKIKEEYIYLHTMPYEEESEYDKVGIRTPKYKYFRHARNSSENINLYDLINDPFENSNIANIKNEIVKEMEDKLVELTEDFSIDNIDKIDDIKLEKIQDELRLLGYKKTWEEESN